jgi:hypothetical protein
MTQIFFAPLFCCCFWIRDPRSGIRDGLNQDPGSGNRDKHPGSATLLFIMIVTEISENFLVNPDPDFARNLMESSSKH